MDTEFDLERKNSKEQELTRFIEINSTFRTSVHGFFPDLSRAYNMVRVIEGGIVEKWSEGKQKLLRVSGRFELTRVRVTGGKITVNVRRKSRGNRHWFELSGVNCICQMTVWRPCWCTNRRLKSGHIGVKNLGGIKLVYSCKNFLDPFYCSNKCAYLLSAWVRSLKGRPGEPAWVYMKEVITSRVRDKK